MAFPNYQTVEVFFIEENGVYVKYAFSMTLWLIFINATECILIKQEVYLEHFSDAGKLLPALYALIHSDSISSFVQHEYHIGLFTLHILDILSRHLTHASDAALLQ